MNWTSAALALTLAGSITAAGHATADLKVHSVGAAPGETVSMLISLSTPDLVGAMDFDVNASGLNVSSVDYDGALFSSGWDGWDTTPSTDPNISAACIFPQDQVFGQGLRLLHIRVDVPADAESGSSFTVGLQDVLISDYSFVPYDVTVTEGTIVVTSNDCTEDLTGDGTVNFDDLLAILGAWGSDCGAGCAADIDADSTVGLSDLLLVLATWGPCP